MSTNPKALAAAMRSKEVNSLVKRHVIRELVKLDRLEQTSSGKRTRIVEKEQEVLVTTSPLPEHNGHRLAIQVVFEGKISSTMQERIDACFNGELKEPLTRILAPKPLGWTKIETGGQEKKPQGETVKKYRVTITKGKGQ